MLEALRRARRHVGPDNVGQRLRSATEIIRWRTGYAIAGPPPRAPLAVQALLEVGAGVRPRDGVCERLARELRQPRYRDVGRRINMSGPA